MKGLVYDLSADYQEENDNPEKRKCQVPRLYLPCVPKPNTPLKRTCFR